MQSFYANRSFFKAVLNPILKACRNKRRFDRKMRQLETTGVLGHDDYSFAFIQRPTPTQIPQRRQKPRTLHDVRKPEQTKR